MPSAPTDNAINPRANQVVFFYNQPQIIGASQLDGFDELQIRHPKRVRILIEA